MNKIIGLILVAIALLPIVSAFEVSFPYFKENKLVVDPGQTISLDIILHNMAGINDETVRVFVSEGAEIARLSGQEYTVRQGTADTHTALIISVPNNAAGKKYNITVVFMTDTNALEQKFVVEVSGQKRSASNLIILAAAAAIIITLLILIIILLRRKR